MSFIKEENRDLTSENMEEDNKVNVEEAAVNLGYLKTELDEEQLQFEENQKIALNFEGLIEQRNNIRFLDDDVIMETTTGSVKLEDIKEEKKDPLRKIIEQSHFEITQCLCCKMWLEKQESLESHMMHCVENYNRLSLNKPDSQRKSANKIDEIQENGKILTPIDENRSNLTLIDSKYSDGIGEESNKGYFSEEEHKYPEYSYQTDNEDNLKVNLNTHIDIKPFQCDICKKRFTQKRNLKQHILAIHSSTSEKEYKCSECSYQTYRKYHLTVHLNTHEDIKPFQCDICKKRFTQNTHLKRHIITVHSNTIEKEYKCSKCSYQTNSKNYLKIHFNTHGDIKPYDCDICNKRFNHKSSLKLHIENKHTNTSEKKYKCSKCSYQTYRKDHLKAHLDAHNDIKPFGCDVCTKKFCYKRCLKLHMENKHANTNEKEHKCSKCTYQTNRKNHLVRHMSTHYDIKPFECDICKKRFRQKSSLNEHIRNQHSNTTEKKFKCTKCSYQTYRKSNLKVHLNTHNDIKVGTH